MLVGCKIQQAQPGGTNCGEEEGLVQVGVPTPAVSLKIIQGQQIRWKV